MREAGEGRARNGTRCEDTPRGGAEGPGGGLQWKQRETEPGEAKAVTEGLWERVTSLGSRAEWEGSSPSVSPPGRAGAQRRVGGAGVLLISWRRDMEEPNLRTPAGARGWGV